jgi:hypothetical protein
MTGAVPVFGVGMVLLAPTGGTAMLAFVWLFVLVVLCPRTQKLNSINEQASTAAQSQLTIVFIFGLSDFQMRTGFMMRDGGIIPQALSPVKWP